MRTVFILGAGASQPYGLPTGYQLVPQILEILRLKKGDFESLGILPREMNEFEKRIRESNIIAIDDLLNQHPQFLELGKLAIAFALVQFEKKSELLKPGIDDDWYRYFFEHLHRLQQPVNPEQYSFITFNYDRSFEEYFDTVTAAFFGNSEQERKQAILDIPIVHIHGQLGILPSRGGNCPYAPTQDRSHVQRVAYSLRITDKEDDPQTLARAQVLIRNANTIRFLGFRYWRTNLDKLEFGKNSANCPDIAGTAYGFEKAEISHLKARNPSLKNLHAHPMKIVEFFRKEYPIS